MHGAEVPYPYGGKPRVIMVDLDQQALAARGLSPADVADALQQQNVDSALRRRQDRRQGLCAGDEQQSRRDRNAINEFPVKQVDGQTVFVRDVAHVHDGFQVQTNSVSVDGRPGALMTVRKTGGVSTLAVIDGVKDALPDIATVDAAAASTSRRSSISRFSSRPRSNSVLMGGLMAAGLTALMILLFLGNWRLTLIILATIPLAIITAILVMYIGGQTLNTMTLGGFALAVGILVDNSTVVIENIERHVHERRSAHAGDHRRLRRGRDSDGAFDAVHLHRVRAGLPAAGHGQISVLAVVAVGLHLADRQPGALLHAGAGAVRLSHAVVARAPRGAGPACRCARARGSIFSARSIVDSKRGFNRLREGYRNSVAFCVSRAGAHQRVLHCR